MNENLMQILSAWSLALLAFMTGIVKIILDHTIRTKAADVAEKAIKNKLEPLENKVNSMSSDLQSKVDKNICGIIHNNIDKTLERIDNRFDKVELALDKMHSSLDTLVQAVVKALADKQ